MKDVTSVYSLTQKSNKDKTFYTQSNAEQAAASKRYGLKCKKDTQFIN